MALHCISISHKNVGLEGLEELSCTESMDVLLSLKEREIPGVLLQTCHRFELYWISERTLSQEEGKEFACDILDVGFSRYSFYTGEEAVKHLLEVACGLESAIIGEYEILGQTRKSYELGRRVGTIDTNLSSLLQTALRVGVRARKETNIAKGSVSIGSVAVDIIRDRLGVKIDTILIIGAGKVAGLLGKALSVLEINEIVWMNRTYERSVMMTKRFNARPIEFSRENLRATLQFADAVILATGCPRHLISQADFSSLREKPVLLVDLGNPRNISPDVANVGWVDLVDLDGIKEWVTKNALNREGEIPFVHEMIDSCYLEWVKQVQRNQFENEISEIYKYAEDIRVEQLSKTVNSPEFNGYHYKKLDLMSKAIIKQILDIPIRNIRLLSSKRCNKDVQKLVALFLSRNDPSRFSDDEVIDLMGEKDTEITSKELIR